MILKGGLAIAHPNRVTNFNQKNYMNKSTIEKILMCAVAIMLGIFIISGYKSTVPKSLGDGSTPLYITSMNVSTNVNVSTTSTSVLAASSGRVYALIVNDSPVPIYLSLNNATAVSGKGVMLPASGGKYEINGLNQYVGIINAITATTATASVTVTASQ